MKEGKVPEDHNDIYALFLQYHKELGFEKIGMGSPLTGMNTWRDGRREKVQFCFRTSEVKGEIPKSDIIICASNNSNSLENEVIEIMDTVQIAMEKEEREERQEKIEKEIAMVNQQDAEDIWFELLRKKP